MVFIICNNKSEHKDIYFQAIVKKKLKVTRIF